MIACPVYSAALENPDQLAVVTESETLTYAQLHRRIAYVEQQLSRGMVSFKTELNLESILLIWACIRQRRLVFPFNPRLSFWEETVSSIDFSKESDVASGMLSLDQLSTVVATSGSSGVPKQVVHTLGNHYYSAKGAQALKPEDCWFLGLPLFHVSGLSILFRCFFSGAAVSLVFSDDVTHMSLVPSQLDQYDISSVKYVLLGGAQLPYELPDNVHPTYGLSEMTSQVVTDGEVLDFRDLKISPDGEILVKGDTLFAGYLNNGVISKHLDHEGYFYTGDLGVWDNGLSVIGRKDRMFISGGENIHPEMIESICLRCPDIDQAIVVPVDHPRFGQRPVAFVEGNGMKNLDSFLKKELPSYLCPDFIFSLSAVKNVGSIKPSYQSLKEKAEEIAIY